MIIKSSDITKLDLNKNNFILLYGKNEGFKKEAIKIILKNKQNILRYDEQEVLVNQNEFLDNIFTKSLFEEEKILVIDRVSDKILKVLDEIVKKETSDLFIILNAAILEKKSKLRATFEKNAQFICIPFYPDNYQSLTRIAYNFFQNKRILISSSNVNLIINKCRGDRGILLNELEKIENFTRGGKKITTEIIAKLTNLIENHDISELIDNCLAKNKNKTINILNENNFTNEDCILIVRTFLNKSKKILKLSYDYKMNKNLDLTINNAKPSIFWKDKEITKQQIIKRTPENLKNLIYKLQKIELLTKQNFYSPVKYVNDFILNQSSETNNLI